MPEQIDEAGRKSSAHVSTPLTPISPAYQPTPVELSTLVSALSRRDLTDPSQGPHALQLLVDDAARALAELWGADRRTVRSRPVVAVEDNYDRLGYSSDAVARDVRYTRYVSPTTMLRSHTSAGVPPALRQLATEQVGTDVLLVLPGMCHRRDAIDREHTGTPHQLDLWLLRPRGRRLDHDDLHDMVRTLVATLVPGAHWRWTPTSHPYTDGGRQVDVIDEGRAVEIAECGLAARAVLAEAGLGPDWSGLALGMGLDRMLMLRKGIPDIRLLSSADPRVAGQMRDLRPYRAVSALPPARRDISVAMDAGADEETIGDRVRDALGEHADVVEEITIAARTPATELPPSARRRLGITHGQENLLVRLVLRPLDRTLTGSEANELRDRIHAALHQGRLPG